MDVRTTPTPPRRAPAPARGPKRTTARTDATPKRRTHTAPKNAATAKPKATPPPAPPQVAAGKPKHAAKQEGGAFQAVGRAAAGVAQPYIDGAKRAATELANGVGDKLKQLKDRVNPPLTDAERAAATKMRGMLEPDKLGGADRTFNHRDVKAVTEGITDTGLKGVIARRMVATKLPAGLDAAGVKNDPAAAPDDVKRKIASSELQGFEKASEVMKGRSGALGKLGLDVQFPGGISQGAIDHILEGKFGLPPGAQLVPIPPPEK